MSGWREAIFLRVRTALPTVVSIDVDTTCPSQKPGRGSVEGTLLVLFTQQPVGYLGIF